MCSFLFTYTRQFLNDRDFELANRSQRQRGPNYTGTVRQTDAFGRQILCVHNLLDISGAAFKQPVKMLHHEHSILCLFNGEVYNFRNFATVSADTEILIPLYLKHGQNFASELDGEFALCIYDEKLNLVVASVDTFLTKPMYIGFTDDPCEFGIASYASALTQLGFTRVELMAPNSVRTFKIQEHETVSSERRLFEFDLKQTATTYDFWNQAFLRAVEKRARHGAHVPFVALSSGYDSGAICAALNELRLPYSTVTIEGNENSELVAQREARNGRSGNTTSRRISAMSQRHFAKTANEIATNVEPLQYFHAEGDGSVLMMHQDSGAVGAYEVARWAESSSRYVCLSGSGADEIISDYGHAGKKFYAHSEFGGLFPGELAGFFPWKKFYGDTQRSYLFKDEFIFGRFGIEGRYPFLDRDLVQAFLHLAPDLKNKEYKAPIAQFLRAMDYPFEDGVKRGFVPQVQHAPLPPSIFQRVARRIVRSVNTLTRAR